MFADADLDLAAAEVVGNMIGNRGQGCLLLTRTLVEEQVHDELVDKVLTLLPLITVGTGGRLHRGGQAVAVYAAAGSDTRRADRRSGTSAGSGQHRHRGRRGLHRADDPSSCRYRELHRLRCRRPSCLRDPESESFVHQYYSRCCCGVWRLPHAVGPPRWRDRRGSAGGGFSHPAPE
ncbi:aldehyde dehydrogenase family protein [Nocardia cyriacigeorgica]|nr:aldehyde dehydrogenase family protein [Nocardia cyriacigeorgica]